MTVNCHAMISAYTDGVRVTFPVASLWHTVAAVIKRQAVGKPPQPFGPAQDMIGLGACIGACAQFGRVLRDFYCIELVVNAHGLH